MVVVDNIVGLDCWGLLIAAVAVAKVLLLL